MKYCKDCLHFDAPNEMCDSEQSVAEIDYIWGRHSKLSAKYMRHDSTKCGIAAKLFESHSKFKKYIGEGVIE